MLTNKVLLKPLLFFLCLINCGHLAGQSSSENNEKLVLWYNRPAAGWNEALPVGNGHLGAMVFGETEHERLQLNEESVWVGKPADFVNPEARAALPKIRELLFAGKYAEAQELAAEKMMGDKKVWSTYQTLGNLWLDFDSLHRTVTDYRRELDIENAVAKVNYRTGDVLYTREVISSAPDNSLLVRLTADKPGALSFKIRLNRPGNKADVSVSGSEIVMKEKVGDGTGVQLAARLKVINEGGEIRQNDEGISIENSDAVTIILTAATDYRGEDPQQLSSAHLAAAEKKAYTEIKKDHIADYQQYFKRVNLDLGTTDAVRFPTDMRLEAMQRGNTDPQLIKLFYQYGRYLLISSSRPGGLPANLQGIWAEGLTPPWSADYHININIQMNYWPAEVANLSEMHMPFLEFLNELRPDARKTAKDMYGLKGAVAHFTTDPWLFTEPYGEPQWAMWPMGLAWSSRHLWEHYQFTEDRKYLEELAYPVLKEASLFCAEWLVPHPETGMLVSGPSISPENTFKTAEGKVATMVMGPTMDHMIIRDLLSNTIEAAEVLNKDAAFRRRLTKVLERLAPVKTGSDGRILEWTEEFEEAEPGHRHISHLYGLHPANQITQQKTPELMEAARKTLAHRLEHGGGHTGWSRAWIINFFARLHNSEAAYENLLALLRKSTLPNLFDNHPPFQIDGNFGAVAGITEMLMQSHTGETEILPALPAAWKDGYIKGIIARGGFEVDIEWEGEKLKELKIKSKLGNTCNLRYGDLTASFKTESGKSYTLDGNLELQ